MFTYVISIIHDTVLVGDQNIVLRGVGNQRLERMMSCTDQRWAQESLWWCDSCDLLNVWEDMVHTATQGYPTRLHGVHSHWGCTSWTLLWDEQITAREKKNLNGWIGYVAMLKVVLKEVDCYAHESTHQWTLQHQSDTSGTKFEWSDKLRGTKKGTLASPSSVMSYANYLWIICSQKKSISFKRSPVVRGESFNSPPSAGESIISTSSYALTSHMWTSFTDWLSC